MEKKERNSRIAKLYVDNGYDIDRTLAIIETIPELMQTFVNKNLRKSVIGVLNYMQVWKKLPPKEKIVKDTGPTKKELATDFCDLLGIKAADVPTLLNMRKSEISRLIDAIDDLAVEIMADTADDFAAVNLEEETS